MPRLNPAYRRRMSLRKITRAILVAGLLASGVVVSFSSQPPASAAPPCVVIYRIYYNSPGTDTGSNYSLNGEWIQLRNRCSTGRSLESWRFRDVAGHTFTFGDFRLGGGQYVKVRTGNGTETATNLYQGRSWYVWNNDKDAAWLRNAAGTLIDTCSYNNKSASSVYC
jgi:lamin tail-like protein